MMDHLSSPKHLPEFYPLKLAKKEWITPSVVAAQFDVPEDLSSQFSFLAGQYITLKIEKNGEYFFRDFSITSAPYENSLAIAVKKTEKNSPSDFFCDNYNVGDEIEVSVPQGRFTLKSKPHEFRTILGFAAGIGISPIFSHFKNILKTEPRTRLFLFYSNKNLESTAFRSELNALSEASGGRLQVFNFLTQKPTPNSFFSGRLDGQKLELIINQLLHLDETDEESTIWDSVDQVLICGPGEMVKSLANACHSNGIPKKNIHFELFGEFAENIYPLEKSLPLIQDIEVNFRLNGKWHRAVLPDNRTNIFSQLAAMGYNVPYSCRAGICGSCICLLNRGNVELLENEYLTESEEKAGKILACMALPLSSDLELDFDLV